MKCILPNGFLGIKINLDGLCDFCDNPSHKNINWSKKQIDVSMRDKSLIDWGNVIKEMQKNKGDQKYDCVIGYSGGKDSTALLDMFVSEFGLNPLAVTSDTGFMTDVAKRNIKTTLSKINVDHVFIEEVIPTFTKIYKQRFTHHESNEVCLTVGICDICSDLIHSVVVREAIKRGIKHVIFGYSPDQIKRYFYEIPQEEILNWLPKDLNDGIFDNSDRSWYPDPKETSIENIPRVLLPYHVIPYNVDEIIKLVESKNLIEVGKADPILTNCHVVKAAMLYDLYRYGGIPYALQYAELIRQEETPEKQKQSRTGWLRLYKRTALSILNGTFNVSGMDQFFKNIGMTREQLIDTIEKHREKDPHKDQILENIELIRTKNLK